MKSGGPWNLRGLHPEAREVARAAARRSGMSVGEWLNSVIQTDDDGDVGAPSRPADFDRGAQDGRRQDFRDEERERDRRQDGNRRGRQRGEDDEAPIRRGGRPYREAHRRDHGDRSRRERDEEREAARAQEQAREEAREATRMHEEAREAARMREEARQAARAREEAHAELGEVTARLDNLSRQIERLARAEAAPPGLASSPRRSPPAPSEPGNGSLPRLTGAPQPPRRAVAEAATENRDLSIEQAVAEITARQRALDSEVSQQPERIAPPPVTSPLPPPSSPPSSVPPENHPPRAASLHAEDAPVPAIDLSGLERQLRQITTRIEALRPAGDLEAAMAGLRGDLSEIGRSITEALPRRAVESLEIEVKALAQRIDHSRQSGVDAQALAGLERGLTDVREALRGLTTAESLVGVDEAVTALAQKVDLIAAKEDPAALQQLETAIGALRGIVSHVASNDALTKVAEDVRALAAKVDALANSTASGHAISALENRIDTLASALNASTEAGHAVPRELEKLLAGLIEKLEWVQLTHTDHAALAHLEDRIAMLVKRLDASDARLGQLAGVERGLADLLVHLEQMRGGNGKGGGASGKPAIGPIERDVAEIKQSERRTQDSLEAVQGTVEHVVDRLAMIETGMRGDKTRAAAAQPSAAKALPPAPALPAASMPAPTPAAAASAAPAVPAAASRPAPAEPAPHRAAGPRPPIDPNLPPDHPLEPGSAAGRSRQPPSAADRIAASEAAIGGKPPVIPDPGGKSDFIAAARRAARTAALASPDRQPRDEVAAAGGSLPKRLAQRLRALIVAAAVVVIVVGALHIASRLFEDGGVNAPARVQSEKPSPPPAALPETNSLPQTAPLAVPGGRPASNTGAPMGAGPASPTPSPGATMGARPGRQSLNDSPESFAVAAPAPSAADAAGAAGATALWSVPEFTGSLSRPAAPQSIASAPAAAAAIPDDKLPATIGAPPLRAAALAGNAAAAYEVAARFAAGRGVVQNSEEAAHWFDRAAKMGLAPAQFRLGTFYEKGIGVKKDLVAARDLYRAAAEKGHGKAMHNLAVLYAEGIDGAADYRTAAQWFRNAADHGITDSQYNLGILYARGIGVEQNFAESYKWFFLAAKQGDRDAAKKSDEVAAHLDRESLAAARLAAQTWRAEPQPADAITVKIPAAWNAPANAISAAREKPRFTGVKAPPPDFSKIN